MDETLFIMAKSDWSVNIQEISSDFIARMGLPGSFHQIIHDIYLPLSRYIVESSNDRPVLVSINGAQGTGKSTLTTLVRQIIESGTGLRVASFSLDDFYLTRQQRIDLAGQVHPLLRTRGVPGTHDLGLLVNTLDRLMSGKACKLPVFNKAMDDRCSEADWTSYERGVDIILFEGWCNNSPTQTPLELDTAINELEEQEDPDATWRQYSNEKLGEYYQQVYKHTDLCVMLKAPNFEHVYLWRRLQEQKLRDRTDNDHLSHVMNDEQLKRFIQHYERITRHTLVHLPEQADIVLPIDTNHMITGTVKRRG